MNSCNIEPIELFHLLLKYFGPQHWWPASSKYEIIIGTLLAQGVNWKNVEKAISNLESENLLSPQKILNTSEEKLIELIKPSRYPSIKVKRLKNLLRIFEEKNFNLSYFQNLKVHDFREILLKVNGIGRETADSILLYAFNKSIFVVDAYTKRILERHGFKVKIKSRWYEEMRLYFEERLPKNVNIYNELHALIVILGNTLCKKNPMCEKCPLKKFFKK